MRSLDVRSSDAAGQCLPVGWNQGWSCFACEAVLGCPVGQCSVGVPQQAALQEEQLARLLWGAACRLVVPVESNACDNRGLERASTAHAACKAAEKREVDLIGGAGTCDLVSA